MKARAERRDARAKVMHTVVEVANEVRQRLSKGAKMDWELVSKDAKMVALQLTPKECSR